MRLHSIRFKHLPRSKEEAYAQSGAVRDLMVLHGCYLQKGYDMRMNCLVWTAHYA